MNDDALFAARVRTLAADVTALPAPADAWDRIAERVALGEVVILPGTAEGAGAAAPSPARATRRHTRRAAAVALLAGALGVAAALPASPVRAWLSRILADGAPGAEPPASAAAVPPGEAAPEASAAGPEAETTLIIDAADGAAVVSLIEPASGVRIRVRFTDADGLEVQARGAVADGRFRSARGQLTIAEAGAGDLVLTVPNRLARLRVLVDGRAYLTRQDGQIRVHSPAADTVGSEIILPVIR